MLLVQAQAQTGQATAKKFDASKALADLNPLKSVCGKSGCNIPALIGQIVKTLLGIVGAVALLMFIYGGFVMLTSGGNEQKIGSAKKTLAWAAIGLAVIFLSYSILNFIIGALTTGGGSSGSGQVSVTVGNCVCSGGGGYSSQGTEAECSVTLAKYKPCKWTSK